MISPELLRRYPLFSGLDQTQLNALAMIADQVAVPSGTVLFEEGQPATALYLLIEGSVDLYFTAPGEGPQPGREYWVGEINPGELFSISVLIEPYRLTAMARMTTAGSLLEIDGPALRALCELDSRLAYTLMRQVAKTGLERLHATRVQMIGKSR
jgi:CRP-like cAMP-binding protein